MRMGTAVEVEDLRVDYGSVHAVRGVSFTVAVGEIFALVGPNGAGKTTTVEVLEGYRRATAGRVSVLGMDPMTGGRDLRERIGIVLQEAGFDEDFTVHEVLGLYVSFYPRRRSVDDLINLVGLADKRKARVKTLSGGQRRRLDLALGLAGDPDLLFLDEPTTGFDPSARRHAWDLVDALRDLGKTVLLTTHYMDEAEHLADRVAVIDAGLLVAVGSADQLRDAGRNNAAISFRLPGTSTLADLPVLEGRVELVDRTLRVQTPHPTRDMNTLTGWAMNRGIELDSLQLSRPSLEEVYLQLTDEAGHG
jgi:ABC-2 type transport system ATP-binding protein